MAARQEERSRQGVGLASPDDSDTPGRTTCEPEPAGWALTMQRGRRRQVQAANIAGGLRSGIYHWQGAKIQAFFLACILSILLARPAGYGPPAHSAPGL